MHNWFVSRGTIIFGFTCLARHRNHSADNNANWVKQTYHTWLISLYFWLSVRTFGMWIVLLPCHILLLLSVFGPCLSVSFSSFFMQEFLKFWNRPDRRTIIFQVWYLNCLTAFWCDISAITYVSRWQNRTIFFLVYFHAIQNQNAVCGSWTRVCNTVQGPSIDRESDDFIWLHIFITFLLSPMAITTNNKQHPSSSLSGFFLFDSRHRLTYHQTKQRLFKLNILIQACVWKQWWWRVAWPASHPFERLRKKKWWRVDKQTSHQFV